MQNNIQVKDVEFSEGVKKTQRERLANRLSLIGKDQLVEEIAYTWFNRLIALRFMEVNGYIDTGVRVLSNPSKDISEPEIISKALSVNLTVDKEKIYNFQDNNDHEGLFKYLFITQCNDLNKDLPFLFEKIGDENILLLPDHLLNTSSVIHKLVTDIPEEDWKEVEIIGWLYQYYVSERKDKLIKAKKKYKTNDIPPVTQLFTPKWIVKYMVENSLGRYWIESHPEHKADLVKNWEFFIENRDEKSKELIKELENKDLKIEDIKIYDPATGSGHILVYAFELLFKIYQKLGYTKSEIAKSILQNNLFGLDIDNRATQLAKFALLMKGRSVDEKIFSKQIIPNIYEIKNGK
ncbi:N-6 DNA methylase [Candidatus Nomurabacteria bacterium]|nr:N-6 DNA methylase [Candidatus Nomurabacteria bacterium]